MVILTIKITEDATGVETRGNASAIESTPLERRISNWIMETVRNGPVPGHKPDQLRQITRSIDPESRYTSE